jgi:histidinol-phosphatase
LPLSARPDDAVLGEKEGTNGRGSPRWILDPIDGTRNYARGIPVWATLLALEVAGVTRLGIVSAPALGRRWWAERGQGAFAGDERLEVSTVARVEDAVLSFASSLDARGTSAVSATSGRTCSWPRARSTAPSTPSE